MQDRRTEQSHSDAPADQPGDEPSTAETPHIELYAGAGPDGSPIIERLPVEPVPGDAVRLLRSPAFVRGIAAGDLIGREGGQYALKAHSGNLCLRIYSRGDMPRLLESVTGPLEKLGGKLDVQTPRVAVFTIHVSCGFEAIEQVLDPAMDDASQWSYGNVYDPDDGVTPLNWWVPILQPQ